MTEIINTTDVVISTTTTTNTIVTKLDVFVKFIFLL